MKLRTLGVVAAGLWLLGAEGCSGPSRDFNRSGGAGGQAGSMVSNPAAGRTAAGSSGRSSSDAGAIDSGGAAGEAGGDSSQGGDPQSDGGVGGALANGGAPTAGASAAGKGGTSAGSGGTSAGGGGASGCAVACASYQFCATSKCLPSYVSTRVLPATDQVNGSGQVNSAVVLTDKAQGDVVVQLSGELRLSDPSATMLTDLTDAGYARYTADGKLAWFRSRDTLIGSTSVSRESALALIPPSDFALSYVKKAASTGPVVPAYYFRLARVNGNTGNLTWEATYPNETVASGSALLVVPRPAQSDFLTFYPVLARGNASLACTVADSGTSASVNCAGSSYAIGAVPGADGATAWIWGAPGNTGSFALNSLSTSQWPIVGNPYQYGGEDAFILGIRGASTSVGPWMTEGDYGPELQLAALPGGDLAVAAGGNGYMTFNGGQSLLAQTGSVLFRLNSTTGQILWRTPLTQEATTLIAAPGGRIAVLHRSATSDPSSVQLFDSATGNLLSTLPLPPSISQQVLAAGQTDLFVFGDYSSAVDFDPGAGMDKPISSRGVYISRYSF